MSNVQKMTFDHILLFSK